MLGVKGTERSEAESSEAEPVYSNGFFEQSSRNASLVFSSVLGSMCPRRARVCLAFPSCLRFSEAGGLGVFESLGFLEFSRVVSSQVASEGSSFSVLGAWPRIWAK